MSEQIHGREVELTQINAELEASLKNCRAILRDCRSRLAANSNERELQSTEPVEPGDPC